MQQYDPVCMFTNSFFKNPYWYNLEKFRRVHVHCQAGLCLPVNIKSSENSCEKICGCDPCTIHPGSCNPYNKCGENGMCNKKEDCKEGLKCGKRNCMNGMGFKKDCCYDPKTSGPKPGEKDF